MLKYTFFCFVLFLQNFLMAQPANDLCSGAILLNPASDCFDIDFAGSTYSGISGPSCPNGTDQPDLWYVMTLNSSTSISISGGYINNILIPGQIFGFVEVYSGSCNALIFESCDEFSTSQSKSYNKNAGSYYFRFHTVTIPGTIIVPGEICITVDTGSGSNCPEIDPLSPASSCTSYQLPIITGSNLSGNEAYYSEQLGQGTMYAAGDYINESTIVYAYVFEEPCISEQALVISIEGNLVESGLNLPPLPPINVNTFWNNEFAWSINAIPKKCDQVKIRTDNYISVMSTPQAICGTLEVENGGALMVEDTFELCVGCP